MKVMDAYVIKINLSHSHSINCGLELLTTKHKSATEAIKKLLVAPGESETPNPKVLGLNATPIRYHPQSGLQMDLDVMPIPASPAPDGTLDL
jgi:hypothetical protein